MKIRIAGNRQGALARGLAVAALAALVAGPSGAALEKYRLVIRNITNSSNVTPNPDITIPLVQRNQSTALVHNGAGPSPVLQRFIWASDATVTTVVPGLAVAIFVSNNFREGPRAADLQSHGLPGPTFTGTGSTSTNIRWGLVTGWSITGTFWCNSNPGIICSLAMGADEASVNPRFNSEFYDLGTWVFHGTGFTATPFNRAYNTNDPGNVNLWIRGNLQQDGTVPALPLIGSVLLGGSLVTGGAVALRRRRDR